MANRKSNPGKTELKKTITPIGQDVPKGGIPVESKSIEDLNLEGSQRSVTGKKVQPYHKDDGFFPKVGPKQISNKIDLGPDPTLVDKIEAKMAEEKRLK